MTQFTLSETYAHPIERVFEAFASPEALARWIAPSDAMPTQVQTMDFTPEGRFRIAFTVDGTNLFLSGQYLTIKRPTQLSFTWIWEAPAPHSGIESHVHVTLKDVALNDVGHGTRLTLTHAQLNADGMQKRHREGWLICFMRLAQTLDFNRL